MKRIVFLAAVLVGLLAYPLTSMAGNYVQGYIKKDGTYVEPYYRSSPDRNPYNNYSYPGNTNPYSGQTSRGSESTYLNNYYQQQAPAPQRQAPASTYDPYSFPSYYK